MGDELVSKRVLIQNIRSIIGIDRGGKGPLKGKEMSTLSRIDDAWLLSDIESGLIVDFGRMAQLPNDYKQGAQIIDANEGYLLPTFVDPHTHLVFGGSREGEFLARAQGKTYSEIAQAGGGILSSAQSVASLSEEALFQLAIPRLKEAFKCGVGAIEIKSGYGLLPQEELKLLRVIKRLKELDWIPIHATYLACHALPKEYKENSEGYVDLMLSIVPSIVEGGLAESIDVFCDQGFFTPQQAKRILEVGRGHGLLGRIHGNELANIGAIEAAIEVGAKSIDHLEYVDPSQMDAMLTMPDLMPTVLPSTAFFLKLPYAPAREMIDAGLPLALGSDFNPGTAPSQSIIFSMHLACNYMKLTFEEAFNATTWNAACSLNLQDKVGSIGKGKLANFILTEAISSPESIIYNFAHPYPGRVFIKGVPFVD